ncbi:putative ATP-dependent hydrolase protein [Pseudorhizobium banfieldiae]|uniref:Putative ATP-dependent hydrolase protein n=2 Tax=Pseudorhizobium banfieldiae TaxID=1125847 RepID=L0NGN4_9HYPH|nr:ATP-dependent zinc metalloprotease FtsH [arsenite-oxidising bacterium NT-25]CCF19991.1 putative ATP-dependent hydrolase protein [Pseudorhizobium banfieldiae]
MAKSTTKQPGWPIDQQKGKGRPVTLPTILAYLGIAAALRPLRRVKKNVLAIIRIEAQNAVDSYVEAIRLFYRRAASEVPDHEEVWVNAVTRSGKGLRAEDELFYAAQERKVAILVCESDTKFEDDTLLFCDLEISVPRPTASQVALVFSHFGHHITDPDTKLLLSATWRNLRFAFPPGRSLVDGLRRLRAVQQLSAPAEPDTRSQGPTLRELHGFGEAAEWGLELALDFADFKSGKIGWEDVDTGVLLSGPPGTGKTMFADALARTCNVPMVFASSAQWQAAGHLNDFLKAMRGSFDEAKSKAPSILFIDEIDAFGDRVVDDHNADYKRQAINGFLELLDGYERRTGVVVVGATNLPSKLDPAIKRAGRLDKHIPIPLPDAEARSHILRFHSGLDMPSAQLDRFCRSTQGMAGADLQQLVRDARRRARRASRPLEVDDVISLLPTLHSIPLEHLRANAIHEAGHAIVGLELLVGELEFVRILDSVTLRGPEIVGGAVFTQPPIGRKNRSFYLDQIALYLAGVAAETLVLGDHSDGGTGGYASDLARATELATQVETTFGLGRTLMVELVENADLSKLRSLDPDLRGAVHRTLEQQKERAISILNNHRAALDETVEELLAARKLSRAEVVSILRRHRPPPQEGSPAASGNSVKQ